MNFDRDYKNQTAQNDETSLDLIGKIQKLPILQRVYLYIVLMAVVGTTVGEIGYRIEAKNCMANDSCWTIEPSQRRVRKLGLGAIAGIFAASLIAIPALYQE